MVFDELALAKARAGRVLAKAEITTCVDVTIEKEMDRIEAEDRAFLG